MPFMLHEGQFVLSKGVVLLRGGDGESPLIESLERFVNKTVVVSLHYMLPTPPKVEPGWGSCLDPQGCPVHLADPNFLWSVNAEGVLSRAGGNFSVGGSPLCLHDKMPGHRGRLLIFEKPLQSVTSVPSRPPDLEEMQSLLKQLRRGLHGK